MMMMKLMGLLCMSERIGTTKQKDIYVPLKKKKKQNFGIRSYIKKGKTPLSYGHNSSFPFLVCLDCVKRYAGFFFSLFGIVLRGRSDAAKELGPL